jgi:hypothetical protein
LSLAFIIYSVHTVDDFACGVNNVNKDEVE